MTAMMTPDERFDALYERTGWRRVEDEMPKPGVPVLAAYQNALGKSRVVRATFFGPHTLPLGDDCWGGCECGGCPEDDAYEGWATPGWYETNDNDETYWALNAVTHWMPLPTPPEYTP